MVRMRQKKLFRRSDRVGSERVRGNEKASLEIQKFLKALDSYPRRFARDPGVSFAQHHRSLLPVRRNGSSRATRHNCDAGKN